MSEVPKMWSEHPWGGSGFLVGKNVLFVCKTILNPNMEKYF
jgi:hypothetical protein